LSNPHVRTDSEGRYSLRGVIHDADLVVKGEAKGVQPGRSETIRVPEGQTKSGVDLKLDIAGSIELELVGSDGRPRGQCLVTATYAGSEPNPPQPKNEFVDESGKLSLEGLKPGDWKLSVRKLAAGPTPPSEKSAEQTVEVRAGEKKPVQMRVD
jgi:hypothetical protein